MKSLRAFALMGLWTLFVAGVLYWLQAHQHYREIPWAAGITVAVLTTHIVNMAIYFRVAGEAPYRWFAQES